MPTPQNGQTHSNNSVSVKSTKMFQAILTIDYYDYISVVDTTLKNVLEGFSFNQVKFLLASN